MTRPLTHSLHRAARIKQIIDRELGNKHASAFRLLRLNALLLKVQHRLVSVFEAGQPKLQLSAASTRRNAARLGAAL